MIFKKLLFLILVFVFSHGLHAQKFRIGPTLGVHAYKVAFHHEEEKSQLDSKVKLGYRGGLYIEFPLENNFSWATEGYYSRKGRKVSHASGTRIMDAAFNFIEISALLRKSYDITIATGIPGKVFFNIGPNINYWVNGKGTYDANVDIDYVVKFQEPTGEIDVNSITNANHWLFGLELGTGMETKLYNNQYFQVEFRFTYGQTYLGGQDSSHMQILGFEDSLRSNYRVLTILLRYGIDIDLRQAKKGKSTIKLK